MISPQLHRVISEVNLEAFVNLVFHDTTIRTGLTDLEVDIHSLLLFVLIF